NFYRETADERRLAETDLLSAHLDFCRGRFAEASRAAANVLTLQVSTPIREAAALILDEIDWIEKKSTPLRSTGQSGNVELTRRHQLLRDRPADVSAFAKTIQFRDALGRGDRERAAHLAAELRIDLPTPVVNATAELRLLRDAA